MTVLSIDNFEGGWFIGDFDPAVIKTKDFEVCYKKHSQGEVWDIHYHKISTEVNYLIRGEMTINGELLIAGDVFTIYPEEVAEPKFLTDCELIVVKTPSLVNDKYIVE